MRFFSEMKNVFQVSEINISERRNTVEVFFEIPMRSLPNGSAIATIVDLIPQRDTITISFRSNSDISIDISNKTSNSIIDLSLLKEDTDEDDIIDVGILIDKTVENNSFSIYSFEKFTENLLALPLIDIMQWFSILLNNQEHLIFKIFDSNISFSTGTMAFVSNEDETFSPEISRVKRLQACRETAYFYNMNTYEILPDDFEIKGIEQKNNPFRPLFDKLTNILSLVFVASSASISETNLNIQINGQRIISYDYPLENIKQNSKFKIIYNWLYTDGNSTDKSLIARNVISLHCKYADLLDIDDKVFDSIKSNYNLYLRNNVVQYLELKREVAKFIRDVVAQIGDYATSILGKFKNNLFAIFGFLFTVVLTKIGATQKWDNIFSRDTIYILEIVLIGSFFYLIICFIETKYKLKKTQNGYESLKNNYKDVLAENEITDVLEKGELSKTVKTANRGIIIWSLIWGFLLMCAIVIIEFITSNKGVIVWLINKIF